MDLSPVQWLILNFTAFMYGFNKTGIVGCAIICTPMMLLTFSPGLTLGIILPLLVVADICTTILLRRSARWDVIPKAIPWAIIGTVLGWWIARQSVRMGAEGELLLKKGIAAILVAMVLFGFYLRVRPDLVTRKGEVAGLAGEPGEARKSAKPWFACVMGIIGGLTSMLANNGGPAWVVFLLSLGLGVKEFLGTAAWLFLILNLTKVPFALNLGFITGETLSVNLYLLPALALGLVVGGWAVKRLSKNTFDNITQVIALLGALYLLFS